MVTLHKLTAPDHAIFLKENRQDPVTGDLIKENDEIVICSACKSAFLKGSWEYLGNRHCEQEDTLEQIPVQNELQFKAKRLFSLYTLNKAKFTTTMTLCFVGIGILFLNGYVMASEEAKSLLLILGLLISFVALVLVLILPTISVDIYGYHLTFRKFLGLSLKIPYNEIKEVTIVYVKNPFGHKINKYDYPVFNHFSVRHTNGLTSKTPINLDLILTNKTEREGFITIIKTLSKLTKVKLQLATSFKRYFDETTINSLDIKWI